MNTYSTEKAVTLNTCKMTNVLMLDCNIQMRSGDLSSGLTGLLYMLKF